MVRKKDHDLRFLVNTLKSVFPDARVLLFGSRARGDYLKESDYDLILISNRFAATDMRERIKTVNKHKPIGMAADIIPLTPEEWEQRRNELSIIGEAAREGIFL